MSGVAHLARLMGRTAARSAPTSAASCGSKVRPGVGAAFRVSGQRRDFMGSSNPRADRKFYKVLGVDEQASQKEISNAYKKLAKKYHPDMSGGDADKFKEVSQAYEILSNEDKRSMYDQFGEQGVGQGGPGGPGGMGQNVDPFDLFSQVFGQGFGGPRSAGPRRTHDSRYNLKMTLEDLYKGTTRDITYNRDVICHSCDGVGGHNPEQCTKCGGTGFVVFQERMGPFVQQVQQVCGSCHGEGFKIKDKDKCRTCSGKKTVNKKETFKVTIPPGEAPGRQYVFQGMADQLPGHAPGDVVIVVQEQPHKTFQRQGDNLVIKKKISLMQALCGFSFNVKHVDGKDLNIASQEGYVVRPNDLWKVDGKGMPKDGKGRGSGFGDLIVEFDVEFPEKLPKAALEHLRGSLAEHVPSSKTVTEVPEGQEKVFAFPTSSSEKNRHAHEKAGGGRRASQGGGAEQASGCTQM